MVGTPVRGKFLLSTVKHDAANLSQNSLHPQNSPQSILHIRVPETIDQGVEHWVKKAVKQ